MACTEYADRRIEATMKYATRLRWMMGLTAGATLLAMAAGCQNRSQNHGERFHDDQEVRDLHRIEEAQIARGAREDATLHAIHFTGEQLNTLGQERLDLMLHDFGVYAPLTVYVDVAPDNHLAARQQAVAMFLKDRGMRDEQIKLEQGSNPDSTTPVVPAAPPTPQQSQQQSGKTASPATANGEATGGSSSPAYR
jgi:hypothetical protein